MLDNSTNKKSPTSSSSTAPSHSKQSSSSSYMSQSNRYYNQSRRNQSNRHAFLNNSHYQQAPFQPAAYHLNPYHFHNQQLQQHHQQQQQQQTQHLIEKYNKKFNLISFCLLRKNEEFFNDDNYYLKDDVLFKEIKNYLLKQDYEQLSKLFLPNDDTSILSCTSSYNCSLFVYTIREALECLKEEDATLNTLRDEFTNRIIKFSLRDALPVNYYSLIDGDYPLRNILHYAAKHNCTLILNELKPNNEILIKMCLSLDYNLNTPIHFACMFNSFEFLKQIPQDLIKKCENAFNDDGLNPFLLACKHSGLDLIRYLFEECDYDFKVREKKYPQVIANKNCLHFTSARFNSLDINRYLNELDLCLAYEPANVVGSIYHVLASNITRLDEFSYFLRVYDITKDEKCCLNILDFRQFSSVDCFLDTLINLRQMVPPQKSFYEYFFAQQSQNTSFSNDTELNLLINKCLYRLLELFKAKIVNLPLITSKLQLLEFLKIINFMAKLTHIRTQFESGYASNFEAFCLKFLNTYVFSGDLLAYSTNSTQSQCKLLIESSDQNNNSTIELITSNESIAASIYTELIELIRIILLSGRYSNKFQQKIFNFMNNFLINLSYSSNSSSTSTSTSISPKSTDGLDITQATTKNNCDMSQYIHSFISLKLIELSKLNRKINVLSLKELARFKINRLLINNQPSDSNLLKQYLKLPSKYYLFINYLSFNLMQDLFGKDFDSNQINDHATNEFGDFL
jgi:hypothetical protein